MKPTQREGKSAATGSCPGVAWVGVDGLALKGHGERAEVEETLSRLWWGLHMPVPSSKFTHCLLKLGAFYFMEITP